MPPLPLSSMITNWEQVARSPRHDDACRAIVDGISAAHPRRVIDDAVGYARGELDERGEGRFTGQLFAFVRERENRPFVYAHLENHVERERQKDDDVAGLFD